MPFHKFNLSNCDTVLSYRSLSNAYNFAIMLLWNAWFSRKILRSVAFMTGIIICVLLANYFYISHFARQRVCSEEGRYIGVLMGTSPYTSRGQENPFFKERLDMAIKLYKKGTLKKVVVSGIQEQYYNEVGKMREFLLKAGLPDSLIVIDSQGTRTWRSVQFVLKHFKGKSIAFISQNFHAERAVFLASHIGINACYFPMSNRITLPLIIRELLSRVRAHLDLVLWHPS